jgi:hypothetical protein
MAGVSKIRELEARKRALVTECEICREMLKAEVHNLQLYGVGLQSRFHQVRSFGPWLMLAVPLVGPLLGLVSRNKTQTRQRSRLKGGIASVLLGLRVYRKYGPLLRTVLAQLRSKRQAASEARAPAANI